MRLVRSITIAGTGDAPLNSREAIIEMLKGANDLARAEILVALRAPQRKLINLLANRAVDLEGLELLEELVEVEAAKPTEWGMF